jgi:hypothetical protein
MVDLDTSHKLCVDGMDIICCSVNSVRWFYLKYNHNFEINVHHQRKTKPMFVASLAIVQHI